MVVMKFGGTSVGNGKRILQVAQIVADKQAMRPIVVVSAMSQVTNALVELAHLASEPGNDVKVKAEIARLYRLHHQTAKELALEKTAEETLLSLLNARIAKLEEILESSTALGELTPRGHEVIISYGERLSIHLVAAALQKHGLAAAPIEASELIVTDATFGNAQPLLSASRTRMRHQLRTLVDQGSVPVITGFMGSTEDGIVTTLGRGGSDYSATIIGYCTDAAEVWIWTDVDGVMTADPRIVKGAHTIQELSYDEAAELSCFGAKVLHPRTIVPAALGNIPIYINNTLHPDKAGTKITDVKRLHPDGAKAITVLNHLSLITVQGKGMQGTYGVAAKVFTALAEQRVDVVFISQASSENNISLVTRKSEARRAVQALKAVFHTELEAKNLEPVKEDPQVSIVAVIGEGMRNHKGIAGRIFSALGRAEVNVIAIAQGSSERNISFVVKADAAHYALQSVHDELHLENGKRKQK